MTTALGGTALGTVVADRLGLSWEVHHDVLGQGVAALAGLAVRDNPKRAHLVVSTVLAKHLPTRPSTALAVGRRLAALVDDPGSPVVLGFCETATGLGHAVADGFDEAYYVYTTRRPDPMLPTLLGFDEEHSHATAHHLQPAGELPDGLVVLVDDELTTGTTALNTIAALEALQPRGRYVVAALLDLRPSALRDAFDLRAAGLGVSVEVVSLLDGVLHLPDDVLELAAPLQAALRTANSHEPGQSTATVRLHDIAWPDEVPTGGRHGFSTADRRPFEEAISGIELPLGGGPVLVVGTEELMHLPIRLAAQLEEQGHDVLVQSTTRSPVLALDAEGYAIRRRLTFPSPDDSSRTSYLYNVTSPGAQGIYSDIVIVTEDGFDSCAGLVAAVLPFASVAVHVVAL